MFLFFLILVIKLKNAKIDAIKGKNKMKYEAY